MAKQPKYDIRYAEEAGDSPLGHIWETAGDQTAARFVTSRGPWRFVLTYDVSGGRARPVELRISLDPGDDSHDEVLTAAVLRSLPLRQMQRAAEQTVNSPKMRMDWIAAANLPERTHDDREYAEWAQVYVQLSEQGTGSPIAVMARARDESPNTINSRLRKARELGLLEGLTSDAANPPRLTPKAKRALRAREPERTGSG